VAAHDKGLIRATAYGGAASLLSYGCARTTGVFIRGLPLQRSISRSLLLAPVLATAVGLSGCGVNAIPTKEETAKAKWADVQNYYQRRADLVPNLVATVQGYAKQERAVLDEVTQARASATAIKVDASQLSDPAKVQQYANAQGALSMALGKLLVANERYPELKSNANFLALQSQLEGTENRIAVARNDYNEAVRDYNTTLRVFPTVLWAKTMYGSSKPMQLFQATATAQSAPTVSFDATPGAAPPASAAPAPAAQ
jgi:LemA protein